MTQNSKLLNEKSTGYGFSLFNICNKPKNSKID